MRQDDNPPLSDALEQNIATLVRRRQQEARSASLEERIAERMTRFTGSMAFVYLHMVIFGGWILINIGWLPVIAPWDPSLVVLAMLASVEAIFLSTFVLISQNRMAAADDKRADLNLQVSLLNEHETTRLIAMVAAIARQLEIDTEVGADEMNELNKDVKPEAVLDKIEEMDTDEAS